MTRTRNVRLTSWTGQAKHMDDIPKLLLLGGRTVTKETEACYTQAKYFRISLFTRKVNTENLANLHNLKAGEGCWMKSLVCLMSISQTSILPKS